MAVKDFRASWLGQVRRLTAATAAITLARLFIEMLCYVLGMWFEHAFRLCDSGQPMPILNQTTNVMPFSFL